MKSLGAIAFSMIIGAVVGSTFMAFTLPPYTASGALPSSNIENAFVIIIYGFFGGIFGVFASLVTLTLMRRKYFSELGFGQILGLVVILSLAHSLVFVGLEYHNAIEGMQPPVLDEFAINMIVRAAVVEFVTGGMISLISVLTVKYALKSE